MQLRIKDFTTSSIPLSIIATKAAIAYLISKAFTYCCFYIIFSHNLIVIFRYINSGKVTVCKVIKIL